MRRFMVLVGLLVALSGCAAAPTMRAPAAAGAAPDPADPLSQLPALRGDYFTIVAPQNGRRYYIHVGFPQGYDPEAERTYPIVYLLDGDSLFPLLAPTHLFLTYDEDLPEAILVGIAYGGFEPEINRRGVDFSAPAADALPGWDGAPAFLSFLNDTLIPQTESRYRVDASRRVLLGQSRGGYFVLWSALEDPDLFWGRIASNPVLTPGRERFFLDAATHARTDLHVAVASGTRDTPVLQEEARAWTGAWEGRVDAPWTVRLFAIQDGLHAASIGESYRQAMVWLFRNGGGEPR